MKNRILFLLLMFLGVGGPLGAAGERAKSDLHRQAEAEGKRGRAVTARSLYIRAFEDYAREGQMRLSVDCGLKGAGLYCRENNYHEAFELLHRVEQAIGSKPAKDGTERHALYYDVAKERMQMYTRIRKPDRAQEQLGVMERQAQASGNDSLHSDFLYTKALWLYSSGKTSQGNAVFQEMAARLSAMGRQEEGERAYQRLIASARRSGNAALLAQSYGSYIQWKDSVGALQRADEMGALKRQIAENEQTIGERESALKTRRAVIIGLCLLIAILTTVLALGVMAFVRLLLLTRKQKRTIREVRESNGRKADFIRNIAVQLEPTLQRLDAGQPEVTALRDFASHIQTLSDLETSDAPLEVEDVSIPQFCEELVEQVRPKVKAGVVLKLEAPRINAKINKEYVAHILMHLLRNAAEYTPEGGHIQLDYKKRGPHSHQFLVSDTGPGIPAELCEGLFRPFREVRDLTQGDGLGLPICRMMARRLNGDLTIAADYIRGARFVLDLHGN